MSFKDELISPCLDVLYRNWIIEGNSSFWHPMQKLQFLLRPSFLPTVHHCSFNVELFRRISSNRPRSTPRSTVCPCYAATSRNVPKLGAQNRRFPTALGVPTIAIRSLSNSKRNSVGTTCTWPPNFPTSIYSEPIELGVNKLKNAVQ